MDTLIILCAIVAAASGLFTLLSRVDAMRLVFFMALFSAVGLKILGAILRYNGIQWLEFTVFVFVLVALPLLFFHYSGSDT